MKKRIAAAFLALVILIAVLPAEAYAAIYNVGDHMWVVGSTQKPTEETEKYSSWEEYIVNDVWNTELQCEKEEHTHGLRCHDSYGNLTCTIEEHKHDRACRKANTAYDWWVVNNADFRIYNIDTDGNPLVGSEFYLLKPSAGENGNDLVIGSALTDEFGQIYVTLGEGADTNSSDEYIFADLEEGENSAAWKLVQNLPPKNLLSNYFVPNTGKWNVTVTRDEENHYTVSSELLEASVPAIEAEQPYNTVNQTQTVVNLPLRGSMLLNVNFEGLGSTPEDMEVSFLVEGPNEMQEPMSFPVEKTGYSPWQAELEDLAMGEYKIVAPEASEVEGFTLEKTRIEVQFPGEEAKEGSYVTLNREHSYATFNITFCYSSREVPDGTTESTSPAVEPSSTVKIQLKNDAENPVGGSGAEFELYDEDADERVTFAGGNGFVLNDYLDVEEGEERTYLLQQTVPPVGHNLAEESYLLDVSKTDGVMTVNVRVNQGLLARLFSRTGVALGDNYEQLATFTNTRKTVSVEVDFEVDLDFGEAWVDEGKAARLREGDYEFTLSWDDAGEKGTETMTLKHGDYPSFEKLLPYGVSYEVTAANENVVITGDSKGKVEVEHLDSGIDLTARRSYAIEVNQSLEKSLVYVDADSETPLAGGKFALNDEDGEEIKTFETGESGEIDILGFVDAPGGTYTLVHTQAPEGYDLLSNPIEVSVKLGYSESEENPDVISQYKLVSVAEHDAVEEKNGAYLIKNTASTVQGGTEDDDDDDVNGTTQIELSLDVEVDFEKGTWRDSSLKSKYQKQTYEFTLQWKEDGQWKSETKKLEDGEEVTFKQKLAQGTEYRILAANPDDYFVTSFSGDDSGTISESQLKKNIQVSATNLYTIEAGDEADLYMVKVDATSTEPLEGAKFTLKDEDGYEIETFKTQEDGEIDIVDLLDEPGSYTLKETRAPEDYDKLNKAISIEVKVEYVQTDDGVQEQNLRAEVSHKSVEQRDDGTYLIKNTHSSDNPKTGDTSGIGIWMGTAVVSAAGLMAVLILTERKKRTTR